MPLPAAFSDAVVPVVPVLRLIVSITSRSVETPERLMLVPLMLMVPGVGLVVADPPFSVFSKTVLNPPEHCHPRASHPRPIH